MTFDDILKQIITLLKRQGRVSYSALKRRFEIDEAYLNDLKDEILYVHESFVEADDRGLTWRGETKATPVMAGPTDHLGPPSVAEPSQPVQETSSPVEPHPPDAERRQLTVMFVDLVGSTELSGRFDPEDLRDVIRSYQSACTEVIQGYAGYVAQHLGDGLLVYFGYPQAHEDDPQRAVHTGLGIVESLKDLNARLEADRGIQLSVRVGIHTGLVVIGEIGSGNRQEQLALGETPNIAARIEGIAEPDTVVISEATYRLVEGFFDVEPLGEHSLKGVAQSIAVHRVVRDRGMQSRFEVAASRNLTPLVGRESESTLLAERWQQAKDGQGQVVLLSGEAGIGKSRLVQMLKAHIADELHTQFECRSSPYFANSALYPIVDFLQRTLRFQTDDAPETKLEKLEHNLRPYRLPLAESVPLFGALLSLPIPEAKYPPLNLSPQRQRQKTLESIMAIIFELAERESVLFILEDLHWGDPTTLELLDLLIDQTPTASLFVLLTCRPEFQPEWSHRSYLSQLSLHRLSHTQIEQIASQVAGGKSLPPEVIEQLVDKTDGVPLYVEEMTKAVLESGMLKEVDGQYERTDAMAVLSIPATLQDSLMARLDRLGNAKSVAQYASVIGRQFSYALLQVASQLDDVTLQQALRQLVGAELVYQRGLALESTYQFKHALVQDTAYASLLRSTRQQYHAQIATALETQFPEVSETQPELLAHHYTEAGLNERAVDCWYQAGQRASERSAQVEAIDHLRRGLHLIDQLPESSRHEQELRFLLLMGPALAIVKGLASPESQEVYARAQWLCQRTGETEKLFEVLYGLRRFYSSYGELRVARQFAEQALNLASDGQDLIALLFSHYSLANVLYWLGELTEAHLHLERGLALSEQLQDRPAEWFIGRLGVDSRVTCCVTSANGLWLLGYPDQALQRVQDAFRASETLSHPYTHSLVLHWAQYVYQWRGDLRMAQNQAQKLIHLSGQQNYRLLEIGGRLHYHHALAMERHIRTDLRITHL